MHEWLTQHPHFKGRQAGPLQEFLTSVTEIGSVVLNKSDSTKSG